jgi:hypothetical protein
MSSICEHQMNQETQQSWLEPIRETLDSHPIDENATRGLIEIPNQIPFITVGDKQIMQLSVTSF